MNYHVQIRIWIPNTMFDYFYPFPSSFACDALVLTSHIAMFPWLHLISVRVLYMLAPISVDCRKLWTRDPFKIKVPVHSLFKLTYSSRRNSVGGDSDWEEENLWALSSAFPDTFLQTASVVSYRYDVGTSL